MYRFLFPKNAHCHLAEAEAIKAKADAAVEAEAIKAAVQLVQAVHLQAAQVQAQAQAAAVKAEAVQAAEDVQDALAATNHKKSGSAGSAPTGIRQTSEVALFATQLG